MSPLPGILAAAAVDARGIWSTDRLGATWDELGVPVLGSGRAFRALFGRGDDTFRRLDRQSRALVLAAEACALTRRLSQAERDATALLVETARGSLEVDLRYVRALRRGQAQGATFPYTLQSTCLGEVALRSGLRGPTLSLSVAPDAQGEALAEAQRLLACGEAAYVVVGRVEALSEPAAGLEPELRAVVALLVGAGASLGTVVPWPGDGRRPFDDIWAALSTSSLDSSPAAE